MTLTEKLYIEGSSGGHEYELGALNAERGVIFLTEDIMKPSAMKLASILSYYAGEGKKFDIIIDSPGGDVSAGLLIYDLLQDYPYDFNIYCAGLAASMAAIILAGGRKGRRFILPHSKVMIHEPLISNGFGGSATKIEQKAQYILDVKRQLNEILAKHTGRTVKEIDTATAFDNFMTAEEAVSFGICDAIKNIY